MVDKYLRAFMAHGQSSGLVEIAGVKVTPENEVKLCTFACRGDLRTKQEIIFFCISKTGVKVTPEKSTRY